MPESKSVETLIIGAGVSGLQTALKLSQNGQEQVTVLEGSDHIGGRAVADGAEWIHGDQDNAFYDAIIKPRTLKMVDAPFASEDPSLTYYIDGKAVSKVRQRLFNKLHNELFNEIERYAEAGHADQSLEQFINTFLEDKLKFEEPHIVKAFQAITQFRLAVFNAADPSDITTCGETEAEECEGRQLLMVETDYPSLLRKHYQSILKQIQFNTVVRAIHVDEDAEHIHVQTNSGEYTAKYVVVTVPLGVLKAKQIHMQFPESSNAQWANKEEAISRLGFGTMSKLTLEFKQCFWDRDQQFLTFYDSQTGDVYNCMNVQALRGKPHLKLFAGGSVAIQHERDPDAIADRFKHILEQIYGAHYCEPTTVSATRWHDDPLSLGSYTYIKPNQTTQDSRVLAEPMTFSNARYLLFAGEATARHFATLTGAYNSGSDAAEQLIAKPC